MFKKFVSYYRKHLGLFLIDMAAALIMAGIDLIYPSFTRTFMNDYIPNRNVSAMINISLFLLILFIIRLICSQTSATMTKTKPVSSCHALLAIYVTSPSSPITVQKIYSSLLS